MTLPAPIQNAIDFGQKAYNNPYTKLALQFYSIYGIYKMLPNWYKSDLHKVVIGTAVVGKAASLLIPDEEATKKLNGLNGMNTKVIGWSVLGVATAGLVGTGIYMLIQHNKDVEAQKALAAQTQEKVNYSQSLPSPSQNYPPAPTPAPTPKPSTTPKTTPAQTAPQTPSFDWDRKLVYPWKQELTEVKMLQMYLNSKGYNSGTADAKLGGGTMTAIASAMGITKPTTFSKSLREILAAAAQHTGVQPIQAQYKISLNDFNNFFNPAPQVNLPNTSPFSNNYVYNTAVNNAPVNDYSGSSWNYTGANYGAGVKGFTKEKSLFGLPSLGL